MKKETVVRFSCILLSCLIILSNVTFVNAEDLTEQEVAEQEVAEQEVTEERSSSDETLVNDSIWEYEILKSGRVAITGTWLQDEVVKEIPSISIPEYLDGKIVEKIGDSVFSGFEKLAIVDLPDTITEIGFKAFDGCSLLTLVNIPKDLKKLGCGAFANTAIMSVTLPSDLEMGQYIGESPAYPGPFSGCALLKNVSFEEGITKIPRGLLKGCTGLSEIVIPDSVVTIEQQAFEGCLNLNSVTYPSGLERIERCAFNLCTSLSEVILPSSLKLLDIGAFQSCTNLTSVSVPAVLEMGEYIGASPAYPGPFNNCEKLNSITFGEGITKIPKGLFKGCQGLQEIIFPKTVDTIESQAFEGCTGLKTVDLPPGLKTIQRYAFNGCTNLQEVSLPIGLGLLDIGAFQNCTALKKVFIPDNLIMDQLVGANSMFPGPFAGCEALNNVSFQTGIKNLPECLFYKCTGLKSITIPNTVNMIPNSFFSFCSNLTTINIPDSVTTIGERAFRECDSLTTIPNMKNVTQIGVGAFSDCSSLTEGQFPAKVTEMAAEMFAYCESLDKITLSDSLEIIGSRAFRGCAFTTTPTAHGVKEIGSKAFEKCEKLEYATIPKTLSNSGDELFLQCPNIKRVTFEEGCKKVFHGILGGTDKLQEVVIPSSCEEIEDWAFRGCENLKSVTIPEGVKSIGYRAFFDCIGLEKISVMNDECAIYDSSDTISITATIYGYAGSTAESYAQRYNRNFVEITCDHPQTEIRGQTEATCSKEGYSGDTYCLVCGKFLSQGNKISKSNHHNIEKVTKATVSQNGKIVTTCSTCSKTLSTTVIPKIKSTTLSTSSYTYNAKVRKPSVVVKDNEGKTLKSGTDYTVTYASGRKNPGKYSVTVKFKGNYSGTTNKTFTIKPKTTSVIKVTAAKKGFKITWKKQSPQVTGYEIQYSTNKNFKKNNKTTIVSKVNSTSKSITKLSAKKKYYVRIRTYKTVKVNGKNTKIHSSWSKAKIITTK